MSNEEEVFILPDNIDSIEKFDEWLNLIIAEKPEQSAYTTNKILRSLK